MEKRDPIIQKLMGFCYDHNQISGLVQTGERTNPTTQQDQLMNYHFVMGTKDIGLFQDPHFLEELFENTLVHDKSKATFLVNKTTKEAVTYHLVLDDITVIELSFVPENKLQTYINNDSLSKLLVNKENLYIAKKTQTDVSYRQLKPTQGEFHHICNTFFVEALNVSKGLYRNQIIYAMKAFQEMQAALEAMIAFHIGVHYNFSVNVGLRYENFKVYLDPQMYQDYLKTYPLPERRDMKQALIRAHQLFRHTGLDVARALEYPYPKEADRSIIEQIRDLINQYPGA